MTEGDIFTLSDIIIPSDAECEPIWESSNESDAKELINQDSVAIKIPRLNKGIFIIRKGNKTYKIKA